VEEDSEEDGTYGNGGGDSEEEEVLTPIGMVTTERQVDMDTDDEDIEEDGGGGDGKEQQRMASVSREDSYNSRLVQMVQDNLTKEVGVLDTCY